MISYNREALTESTRGANLATDLATYAEATRIRCFLLIVTVAFDEHLGEFIALNELEPGRLEDLRRF